MDLGLPHSVKNRSQRIRNVTNTSPTFYEPAISAAKIKLVPMARGEIPSIMRSGYYFKYHIIIPSRTWHETTHSVHKHIFTGPLTLQTNNQSNLINSCSSKPTAVRQYG